MSTTNGDSDESSWLSRCRLCLSNDSTRLDIFVGGTNSPVVAKLKECLNLVIYDGDPLPKKICTDCWKKVNAWLAFISRVDDTTTKVDAYLKENKERADVKDFLAKLKEHKGTSSDLLPATNVCLTNSLDDSRANTSGIEQETVQENHINAVFDSSESTIPSANNVRDENIDASTEDDVSKDEKIEKLDEGRDVLGKIGTDIQDEVPPQRSSPSLLETSDKDVNETSNVDEPMDQDVGDYEENDGDTDYDDANFSPEPIANGDAPNDGTTAAAAEDSSNKAADTSEGDKLVSSEGSKNEDNLPDAKPASGDSTEIAMDTAVSENAIPVNEVSCNEANVVLPVNGISDESVSSQVDAENDGKIIESVSSQVDAENGGQIIESVSSQVDAENDGKIIEASESEPPAASVSGVNEQNSDIRAQRVSLDANISFNIKCEVVENSDEENWNETTIAQVTQVEGSANNVWSASPVVKSEMMEEYMVPEDDPSYNLRPRRDFIPVFFDDDLSADHLDEPESLQKITPWKCSFCQIYLSTKASLKRHYAGPRCKSKKDSNFTCLVCSRIFVSMADLAEHQVMHLAISYDVTADDLLACEDCDQHFCDMSRLRNHSQVHKTKSLPRQATRYTCTRCDQVFIKRSLYSEHLRSHDVVQLPPPAALHALPIVQHPSPSSSRGPLITTNVPVTMPTEFSCSLCPKRFIGEDLLYDHRFAFHGIPDERVTCTVCEMKFRNPAVLAQHMESHKTGPTARKTTVKRVPPLILNQLKDGSVKILDNNNVRCRRCGRVFTSAEDLLKHESIQHKNPTPHVCRTCSKKFDTRSHLLIHHRTHCSTKDTAKGVEQSPMPVPQPSMTTTQSPMTTAQPPMPPAKPPKPDNTPEPENTTELSCLLCRVKFRADSDLQTHLHTHTLSSTRCKSKFRSAGKNFMVRYQCSHCPQLFSEASSITRHRLTGHGGMAISFIRLSKPLSKKNVQGLMRVKCTKCKAHFFKQSNLDEHMLTKHPPKQEIKDPQMEVVEVDIVGFNTGTVVCPMCGITLPAAMVPDHIKNSHGPPITQPVVKKLKCRYCPKTTNTTYNLKKHEACHDPQRSGAFSCSLCKMNFDSPSNYKLHRHRCAGTASLPVVSPSVPSQPSPLPNHRGPPEMRRMVPVNMPKSCPICMKTYDTSNVMELHVATVHGADALQRMHSQVGQSSSLPVTPALKRRSSDVEIWHEESNKIMRIANGVIRCTLCKISFTNNDAAARHKARHPRGNMYLVQIGDSLFQCTVCNNFVNSRINALEHAQEHAEPVIKIEPEMARFRTFNCPFCSSTFASEESIRSHIFYVHPEGSINLN